MIKIRGQDCWGSGHYDAPRDGGKRKHKGVDLENHTNEAIEAFESGVVSKIGWPYSPEDPEKGHYRYIEIVCNPNIRHRYLYCEALVQVGNDVEKGSIIGWAQDLGTAYPGITQHVHFGLIENGKRINPTGWLKKCGYLK